MQAIKCEVFDNVKLDITKDISIKPDSIISKIKQHNIALEASSTLGDTSLSGKLKIAKTRRASSSSPTPNKSNNNFGNGKPKPTFIPKFPAGLKEVLTKEVWVQLCDWRTLCNRSFNELSRGQKHKLKNFKVIVKISEERKHNRKNSGRSPKSNRYSDDRKRSARRARKQDSASEHTDEDGYSTAGLEEKTEPPKKKSRRTPKRDKFPKDDTCAEKKVLFSGAGILKKGA